MVPQYPICTDGTTQIGTQNQPIEEDFGDLGCGLFLLRCLSQA